MFQSFQANRSRAGTKGDRNAHLRVERLEERATPAAVDYFAVGSDVGSPNLVKVFDPTGTLIASFRPFGAAFKGGVRVAVGNVTDDGNDDLVVAAASGAPRVKVFSGADLLSDGMAFTGTGAGDVIANFLAFGPSQTGGVFVACDDLNSNTGGPDDVIVGAGPGAPPRIKIFDAEDIATEGLNFTGAGEGDLVANFLAYSSSFRGGVRVAAGDFNIANGFAEVIAAPGPGASPRVKVFNGNKIQSQQLTFTGTGAGDVVASFLAYGSAFRGGVWVASSADFNSDTRDDLVVGPGAGMAPRVKVFSGFEINEDGLAFTGAEVDDRLASFLAFPPSFTGGVRVGAVRLGGNDLVLTGLDTGPGIVGTFLIAPSLTTTYAVAFDISLLNGVFVSS